MKAVFRVDSSNSIGAGHLMRCLALAKTLQDHNVQVSFVCRELPGNFIKLILDMNFTVSALPQAKTKQTSFTNKNAYSSGVSKANDAIETIKVLGDERPDWLIVDHYELDIEWEASLRAHCKSLMVIDDLANRQHDCDILLDQNYSIDNGCSYKSLVPLACRMLLGPDYALLRPEFQLLSQRKSIRNGTLKKILIFFTAGDDQGETLKAMRGVALFGRIEQVDVVVGNLNVDIPAIQIMCADKNWRLHIQIDYMSALIDEVDLVIGGSGSSNWERCALGVPALVVILAENQLAIAQALHNAGAVINLGRSTNIKSDDYVAALKAMTPQLLTSLSEKSSQLVDGRGTQRLAEVLVKNRAI